MGFPASWMSWTNTRTLLAGKKSRLDRGMERFFNRKVYNVLKKFHSRVGANMVAANVGSALTNFIPIAQAAAQTGAWNMVVGMRATLKNYWNADGLSAASVFINNRSGYGRLAESTMDKVSEKAGILMEIVDRFTTGSVVRARYYQNLQRGMSETSAMQEADQFASGVHGRQKQGVDADIICGTGTVGEVVHAVPVGGQQHSELGIQGFVPRGTKERRTGFV